ncbi:MAG: hypothetical protein NTX66_03530 [Candidatus Falkowbacteria bacterium]|nr:hypothetical protein [Candidatus Falkowbacteria bacterium]
MELKELHGTQYGDYSGEIQIDTHAGSELFNLAKIIGIDHENYFAIGFGLSDSEPLGENDNEVHARIITVSKKEYGNSFDEIQQKIISLRFGVFVS